MDYDQILLECTTKIDDHRSMNKPCANGNYVIAVDGHVGVKIPKKYLQKKYEVIKDFPNLQKIIDECYENKFKNDRYICQADLNNAFNSLKMVDKYDNCTYCYGSGDCTCDHCGDQHECGKCGGTGNGENVIGKEYDWNDCIQVGKATFNANKLNILRKLIAIFNGDITIKIITNKPNSGNLFLIDDIEFIIMPLRIENPINDIPEVPIFSEIYQEAID